jgi:hypothetical protein
MTVIPLGPSLPTGSSRLPADSASSVVVRLFGVAPDGGCRVSPAPQGKRLVSVALFLAFARTARPELLRPGVTRHPALWSPDFPLPRNELRGSDDLAGFAAALYGRAAQYVARRFGACTRAGSGRPAGMAAAPGPHQRSSPWATCQRSSVPARSGTIASSPNGNSSGTVHASRTSVIESAFGASP